MQKEANQKKFLDRTKLKQFADNNLDFIHIMIYVFDQVENMVGKGEKAGYEHFFLFQQCFLRASFWQYAAQILYTVDKIVLYYLTIKVQTDPN